MSLSFCVLGSGSAGNSTLIIAQRGTQRSCMLIDCGLSPRATATRLAPLGLQLADINAIILTHLDTDHFYLGWLKALDRFQIPLFVHRRHRNAAWQAGLTARQATLFERSLTPHGETHFHPILLAHDDLGSVGYVVQHEELRLGYATDVGCIPPSLFDHFSDLNALAIESNYDREMQLASGRPIYLKRRIMGGRGHLSNIQSLQAVHRIAQQSGLSHIALLHLSRQCNDPDLVRSLYEKEAPQLARRLTLTHQVQPTPLLTVRRVKPVCCPPLGAHVQEAAAPHRKASMEIEMPLFAGLSQPLE